MRRYDYVTAENNVPPIVKVVDRDSEDATDEVLVAEIYISENHPTQLCVYIAETVVNFLESLR